MYVLYLLIFELKSTSRDIKDKLKKDITTISTLIVNLFKSGKVGAHTKQLK